MVTLKTPKDLTTLYEEGNLTQLDQNEKREGSCKKDPIETSLIKIFYLYL